MPPGGEGSLHQECCLLPCVVRHLQSCGLGNTEHHSQDSTISALSQFLPLCWVSNGQEELAGVTLAAPFPLTRGYEHLFLPQFSSPDGEPWWNPPSPPGSQTGRSSLTPGPVLVLARRVSGQPLNWARCPYGLIPLRVIPYVYSSTVRFPSR